MNIKSESLFTAQRFVQVYQQYRKLYWMVAGSALVVFTLVAFMMPEYYEAEVILYPASSSSISQSLLDKNVKSRDILKFGEKEEVEQVQQILQSDQIRSRITERFNLLKHYDLQNNTRYQKSKLNDTYDNNVTIRRTKYNSVRIHVLDQNPDTAARMANAIADLLDTTMNNLQKSRAIKAFEIVDQEYQRLQAEINFLGDSLTKLRNLGLNDYESQSEVFNQALAQAILKNDARAIESLNQKIEILSKYGSSYVQLSNYIEFQTEQLSILHSKYAEAKVDLDQSLPHKFIVSSAFSAEQPTYPIKWLVILIGIFSALLLLTVVLFTLEKSN